MNTKSTEFRLLIASVLMAVALHANAASYTFTDLGAPNGANSVATAINNVGQIVGGTTTTDRYTYSATLWLDNGTTTVDLGQGRKSWANGINDLGQVVGSDAVTVGTSVNTHATLWHGGTATDLGTLGGANSYATSINNAGLIVGASDQNTSTPAYTGAVVWTSTTAQSISSYTGSVASAINNSNWIAGTNASYYGPPLMHATLWFGATPPPQDLSADPKYGPNSRALAINDNKQVAGWVQAGNDTSSGYLVPTHRAVRWEDGSRVMTELNFLGSGTESQALGINNAGSIVGFSTISGISNRHATLWDGVQVTDLNSFLDPSLASAGWVLNYANDINDQGWIVGSATNSFTGLYHAYLLAPVPEPSSAALYFLGLPPLAYAARRRKIR